LLAQRIFKYGITPNDILELPYCMYNDLILKQIELKKKEDEIRNKHIKKLNQSKSRGPVYFPDGFDD
jgi:hypothetical protein